MRGGNAFTLFGSRDVARRLAEDWPWLAVPVAYDLSVALTPAAGLEVAEGYGFPTADKQAELKTSTVFLSKRRGALLVRLEPTAEPETLDLKTLGVSGTLSYETPAGETVKGTLETTFKADLGDPDSGRQTQAFAQPSVGKTVALALLVSGMKNAAERYAEALDAGAALMRRVADRFEADTEALDADALEVEVTLARDLLALMEQGAPQGTLYGAF